MWMTCTGICRHRLGCPLMEIAICCCWWGRRASWIFIARSITAAESTQGQRPNETNQRPRWWRPPASRRGRSIESVASLLIDGSIDGSSLALWPAVFILLFAFFGPTWWLPSHGCGRRARAPLLFCFFSVLSLSLSLSYYCLMAAFVVVGRFCLFTFSFSTGADRTKNRPRLRKRKREREREREAFRNKRWREENVFRNKQKKKQKTKNETKETKVGGPLGLGPRGPTAAPATNIQVAVSVSGFHPCFLDFYWLLRFGAGFRLHVSFLPGFTRCCSCRISFRTLACSNPFLTGFYLVEPSC